MKITENSTRALLKMQASGLSQLKSQIESSSQNQNVVGYGMKVNDGGTATFFCSSEEIFCGSESAYREKKQSRRKKQRRQRKRKLRRRKSRTS